MRFVGMSDSLDPSAEIALARLAGALGATPGNFLIEAHTAPSGDVVGDQWLTDQRAAVVRARLIAAGVPPSRLFAMGFGAARAPRGSDATGPARIEVSRMP